MEILFSQQIEFATITPFKNHSNLATKIERITLDIETGGLLGNKDTSFDELLKDTTSIKMVSRNSNGDKSIYLDRPTKKRGKYFYLSADPGNDIEERLQIDLDYLIKREKKSITTTKQRHINRHFKNPFSSISIERVERSVVRRDNKITIKLYHRYKKREVNWKYFKVSTFINSITIDTNTGNFTITEIANSKGKKIKKFRRNYFPGLSALTNHHGLFYMRGIGVGEEIKNEYENIFDNEKFYNAVSNILGFGDVKNYNYEGDLLKTDGTRFTADVIREKRQNFIVSFMVYFCEKKKIKRPDNYFMEFLTYYYPTEKYLKKNKRKLVASILAKYDIKSGITVKLLHTNPTIDIITLVQLCKLLGDDYPKYIGTINPSNFDKVNLNPYSMDYNIMAKIQEFEPIQFTRYQLSDIERENLITIINSLNTEPVPLKTFYGALTDHFDMIKKIRLYVPSVYLNARNYNDFTKEHSEYSKILSLIKKPFVTEYVFDEKTVETIEKKIPMIPFEMDYTDEDYIYPVLLKREEEYSEEGSHMHHCVASYSNKESSIIISLRNYDGTDRVTSEFNIKSGECWQSRYFYNGAVPQNFEYALTTLKNRVTALAKKNELKWLEKRVVRAVINGIEIPETPLVLGPRDEDIQPQDHPPVFEDIDIAW